MEIQGINTTRNDLFPFSALRVLGGVQMFAGTLCVLLGVADLCVMLLTYDAQAAQYPVTSSGGNRQDFDVMVDMTVASAPIWCGVWYMVTGSLGTCVSRGRSHSLKFLKIAFLVLSVLCAAFFAPACTVLSCMIAVTRHTLDYSNLMWLVSTTAAFLSFCETGIAIVSASVCCCCAPLALAKVHIVFGDNKPPKPSPPPPPPPARKRQVPEFQPIPERKLRREQQPHPSPVFKIKVKDAKVQTDRVVVHPEPLPLSLPFPTPALLPVARSITAHPLPPPVHPGSRERAARGRDPRYPALQRPSPRAPPSPPEPDYGYQHQRPPGTSGSVGYDRLRKWALPHGHERFF